MMSLAGPNTLHRNNYEILFEYVFFLLQFDEIFSQFLLLVENLGFILLNFEEFEYDFIKVLNSL